MGKTIKVAIVSSQPVAEITALFAGGYVKSVMIGSNQIDSKVLSGIDLVIEATGSEGKALREILNRCDAAMPPEAILATTAATEITALSVGTKRPEKFVGLTFTFGSLEDRSLIQIIKSLQTSVDTVSTCREILGISGASVIEVEDSPGLITDRVMALIINEAALMHSTNVASIEDIDRITRLCLNWPRGPFEFADTIGIDKVLANLELLSREHGEMFLPCRLLRQMVAAGRLGKASGRGFYSYG